MSSKRSEWTHSCGKKRHYQEDAATSCIAFPVPARFAPAPAQHPHTSNHSATSTNQHQPDQPSHNHQAGRPAHSPQAARVASRRTLHSAQRDDRAAPTPRAPAAASTSTLTLPSRRTTGRRTTDSAARRKSPCRRRAGSAAASRPSPSTKTQRRGRWSLKHSGVASYPSPSTKT